MAQRRFHYERSFEQYLRASRVPYLSVDEAKKALLPANARLRASRSSTGDDAQTLKSFDFVIYGEGLNLLVEVKGRRISGRADAAGRLESWVTREDVESLLAWEHLFGPGFASSILFLYWCEAQPPDALFEEMFEDRGRWYAVRACRAADYAAHMRTRSPRWGTVDLSREDFERLSGSLFARSGAGVLGGGGAGV